MVENRGGLLGNANRTAKNLASTVGSTVFRAAGNVVVPVVGGVVGGIAGGKLGKWAYDSLKYVAALVFTNAIAGLVISLISSLLLVLTVAFIMFIINTSAYVAPSGGSILTVPPGNWPTINVGASCPIPGGQILVGSYGSPNGYVQHGTNAYWDSVGQSCTAYSLPYTGICYARQVGDDCYSPAAACDYYGYAADIIYPGVQLGGQPVYLPYIEGDNVTWTLDWGTKSPTSNQSRGVLNTVHEGTSYSIYVTHLIDPPVGGSSGSIFAYLYPGTTFTPHLHIELRIDGEFVPPDFMCSGGDLDLGDVIATEGCFQFSGPWPQDILENEIEAASIIMSNTPYSDRLCEDGAISVIYETPGECEDGICYGGVLMDDREIKIFPPGAGSVANSLFTLAHESAHVYDIFFPGSTVFYRDPDVLTELPLYDPAGTGVTNIVEAICTYPLDRLDDVPGKQQIPFENFAEAVALFIAGPNPVSGYRDFSCLGGTFLTRYPLTWQYMRDNIFFNDGPW